MLLNKGISVQVGQPSELTEDKNGSPSSYPITRREPFTIAE